MENSNLGVPTAELVKTELGEAFVKARDRAESLKQYYRTNEIGEQEMIAWNPFKLREKNPYAQAISDVYDKMIERTIPENVVLSTRFQNWIIKEKNELMVDTRINKDDYFREQIDFKTGIITHNRGNAILQAKMDYVENKLAILEKSFKKHMQDNPQIAFASKEELEKWQNYYNAQKEKTTQALESGDFSYYDQKDKDGNIIQMGTEQDALKHQESLDNLINKVDNAQTQQEARIAQAQEVPQVPQASQVYNDYVGNALEKNHTLKRKQ